MRVKEISYQRLSKLGGFENARIGIVIELNSEDSEDVAMMKARNFVESNLRLVGASLVETED